MITVELYWLDNADIFFSLLPLLALVLAFRAFQRLLS